MCYNPETLLGVATMKRGTVNDCVEEDERNMIKAIPSLKEDVDGKAEIPPNLFGALDSKDHTFLPDEWCNALNVRSYWSTINPAKDRTALYHTNLTSTSQFQEDAISFIKQLLGKGREAASKEMCNRAEARKIYLDDGTRKRTPTNEDELMQAFMSKTMKEKFKDDGLATLDDYFFSCRNLFEYGNFKWAYKVVKTFCN